MKKLLVVLGMGGHTSQSLRLVDLLGPRYEYEYIIGHDDQTSAKKITLPGKTYVLRNPRLMSDTSIFKVFWQMFPNTWQARKILKQSKPDAVLSAGPALSISLFWLAKIKGIKTIFVESWVRVHHKSWAGKFTYPVSDLFLVQWESLKKAYPKAVFAGRLS